MKCPFCEASATVVKDTRNSDEGKIVRRRRLCIKCRGRFTTFERIQRRDLIVVKRSGAKRPFDPTKVANSIATALRKRNFTPEQVEEISKRVILEVENGSVKEIPTRKIGKLIMDELEKIDPVAYIRFASVYKDFTNIEDFTKFISKLQRD